MDSQNQPTTARVPLTNLEQYNPFLSSKWGMHGPLRREEVAEAIAKQDFITESWDTLEPDHKAALQVWGIDKHRAWHTRRVAYLVVNRDRTPLWIDVGCPSLGHHKYYILDDGHHRLAAAAYLDEPDIEADIQGECSLITRLCTPRTQAWQGDQAPPSPQGKS